MTELKYSTEEYQKKDSAHFMHPFTDSAELEKKGARIVTKAEGVYVYDSEGNKILDAMAGLWCVNVGYGRDELADVASAQMKQLPFYNSFFQTTTPPTVELAEKLASIAPDHMNHVFFTGSGSESNDTMLRMVRRYWQLKGEPQKSVIISRKNGYHGSTVAGASLGGMGFMHEQAGKIPGIVHIDQPYWYAEGGDEDVNEFGLRIAQQLEEKILDLGVDRVAAFLAEPIQGAGGVIIPPETYWPEIQRITNKYGILLVADEVICGFGRTGEWFGSDSLGIKPDLMPIAKGLTSGYLPMGGLLVGDRVADVIRNECGEFAHGFTYSGHPASAAVALRNIEIMERENIVGHVKNVAAPHLAKRWAELADHELVGEARSFGLVAAIELTPNKETRAKFPDEGKVGYICREHCFNNGLIMRGVGDTMIISPPLVISPSEIDELVEKAKICLDATLADIKNGALED